MRIGLSLMLAALLAGGAGAQQPNYINRLATTVRDDLSPDNMIAFTDAETGETVRYRLPKGHRPASCVAMDRYGDVWIDDLDSFRLLKLSAVDGTVLAVVNPGRRATYMVTDIRANLIVGSANTLTGAQAAVYIDRYTHDGAYIDGVDLRTLFPPGVFSPLTALFELPKPFAGAIPRILVTRSGAIWLGVLSSAYNPVIKLNPDLTLAGSYGLYLPGALVPDDGEGLWVWHYSYPVSQQYPLNAPPIPGLPPWGWVHLSTTGQVLEFNNASNGFGTPTYHSLGHRRYDGRQFQYPSPGGNIGAVHIWVSKPENPPYPWFIWDDRIDFGSNFMPYNYLAGFFLDGAQRVWALRNSVGGGIATWSMKQWTRIPVEQPYSAMTGYEIGQACRGQFPTQWYWTTYWGNASLFEYVHYTDPYGDLDGDGVMNYVELANFSNALLPYGLSPAATATGSGGGPGGVFTVDYTIPGDQGLAYAAPFALVQPHLEPLGGGHFLPVSLTDPLVQLSLQPGTPGLSGTLGVLDGQGNASASIQIPPVPSLSGLPFATCIATRDPNLPLPLKTVSRAFHFTLP